MLLTTLGLPGTCIFSAKLFFFMQLSKLSATIVGILGFVFLVWNPIFLMRVWSVLLGGPGSKKVGGIGDLTREEFL